MRHWINMGLHVNTDSENDNMRDTIRSQTRVKELLFKLMDKQRTDQIPEVVPRFSKWYLYDTSLWLYPGRLSVVKENIYPLHCAIELNERNEEYERMLAHVAELRELART